MKKHLVLFALVAIGGLFYRCSEPEPVNVKGSKTTVTLSVDSKTSQQIPDGSTALLSLSSSHGQELLSDHMVTLTRRDGSMVTEAITLQAGDAVLSEFVVLHNDEVLYAAPKEGSSMAGAVSTPLGQRFAASKPGRINVEVEVMDAKGIDSKRFGYESFKKKPKNTFNIIAYFFDNGVKTPLTSYLQIRNEEEAFYYYMDAEVNTFTFEGDHNRTYLLTAYRPGFYREEISFTLNKMKVKKDTIEIIMDFTDPADRISLMPSDTQFNVTWGMVGVGSLYADYHDGSGEYAPYPLNAPPNGTRPDTVYLTFNAGSDYYAEAVTVTGDLDQVVQMEVNTSMSEFDLSHLPKLADLTLHNSYIEGLDLSANTELRYLALINCGGNGLVLDGLTKLRKVHLEMISSGTDSILTELYSNVSQNNITGGQITIAGVVLSVASQEILADLESEYDWLVIISANP